MSNFMHEGAENTLRMNQGPEGVMYARSAQVREAKYVAEGLLGEMARLADMGYGPNQMPVAGTHTETPRNTHVQDSMAGLAAQQHALDSSRFSVDTHAVPGSTTTTQNPDIAVAQPGQSEVAFQNGLPPSVQSALDNRYRMN